MAEQKSALKPWTPGDVDRLARQRWEQECRATGNDPDWEEAPAKARYELRLAAAMELQAREDKADKRQKLEAELRVVSDA